MILHGSLPSTILGMDTGITIITPGNYHWKAPKKEEPSGADQTATPYRAVYLLHGLYGNHMSWAEHTMLPEFADDCQAVFIMPEAGRSLYTDMVYGLNYFTYISEELPQLCTSLFRISSRREDTWIAGGSLGGFGALKCALSRPDRFGHCIALSSACLFMREDLEALQKGDRAVIHDDMRLFQDMKAAFGERLQFRKEDDLLSMADNLREKSSSGAVPYPFPHISMIWGDTDPYRSSNRRFAEELRKRSDIPCICSEIPGAHDWSYFNYALKIALDNDMIKKDQEN